MSRRPYPLRRTLRNGWSYIGRCRGRDYVTIIDPNGEPHGIYYTVRQALAAIKTKGTPQ